MKVVLQNTSMTINNIIIQVHIFFGSEKRTRQLDHAHIEYIRNLYNLLALKISSQISSEELITLILKINPKNEKGKIVLIPRLGANKGRNIFT